MDKYPLGPFPAELINYLIRGDPQLYSSLARTSSRLNSVVRQSLPVVCNTPIKTTEVIRYLKDPSSNGELIVIYSPKGKYAILSSHGKRSNKHFILTGGFEGVLNSLLHFDELPILFQELTRHGFIWFDLQTVKKIVSLRTSCVRQNLNYPLKFVWNTFLQLRGQTKNSFVLDDFYRQMANILGFNLTEFGQRLRQLEDRLRCQGTNPDILRIEALNELHPVLKERFNGRL